MSLPISTEVALFEACREEIVKQVERLDDLGKELIKIELIIPGIYTVTSFEIRGTLSHDQAWVPDGAHGRS